MCGRYQIELSSELLREIIAEVQRKQQQVPEYEQLSIKFEGEVFPTDIVPVQVGQDDYRAMRWGFKMPNGRPLINARSETALQKPIFRPAMLGQRCAVPASAYYEWQKTEMGKIKRRLSLPDSPLFFAGCYRFESNESVPHFVILTQTAIPAIRQIHDRMPVILSPIAVSGWLSAGGISENLLHDLPGITIA